MTRTQVTALAKRTSDAYSFDRYGRTGWCEAIRILVKHGLTEREIEAVLRSKWMRWAADTSGEPRGWVPGKAVKIMLDDHRHGLTPVAMQLLMSETFGTEVPS